jgi:Fur family zinc uptake transcriptional regulator
MGGRKGDEKVAYVLEALVASSRPLGAYDLNAKVRPRAAATLPTLKRPISVGKVHRIESLNAFVACRHSGCSEWDNEHEWGGGFSICDRCGSVDEFADPLVVARAFRPRALTIEVQGLCGECRLDEAGATA